jgi:hypothetical protein
MKIWHWLFIAGSLWFVLRKKEPTPTVPAGAAVPQPTPAEKYDATQRPNALIDLLRTRLDPAKRHQVITFNDGRVLVETWGAGLEMTQSFGSLSAAMAWAMARPFSRAPALVNWEWAGR